MVKSQAVREHAYSFSGFYSAVEKAKAPFFFFWFCFAQSMKTSAFCCETKVLNSSAGEKTHHLPTPVMEKTDISLGNQLGNKESFQLLLEQASGLH